ncbi:MAG: bifunctional diguanylate cyclase/phosphodiesterase [Acidobacteriaceae bacterium]|nr:bifunctional diguanylate cyclase/phosphodiesterase [Acidobacteriaceae bacterium]
MTHPQGRISLLRRPPPQLVSILVGVVSVAAVFLWPWIIVHHYPLVRSLASLVSPAASPGVLSDAAVWLAYVVIATMLTAVVRRSRLDARTRWMLVGFFALIATAEFARLIIGGLFAPAPPWLTLELRILAAVTAIMMAIAVTWVSTAYGMARAPMAEYYADSDLLDPVTELPPLRAIQRRLSRDIRRDPQSNFTVLVVDLDQFKRVNKTLGHHAGNQLIAQAARRLRQCLRNSDTIARIGADEFAIYVRGSLTCERALDFSRALQRSLAGIIRVEDHELVVTASIGITVYPDGGSDAFSLLRNAETAMYHAKHGGTGHVAFFTTEMAALADRRVGMERALRHAIERGEIALHYQPQVSLLNGSVSGLEALMRWNSRDFGPVPPSDFIPLAEETNLMTPLTDWLIAEACRFASTFNADLDHPISFAINISPSQLHREDLPQVVENALSRYRLDGKLLEIEITENALMDELPRTMETLARLRALGVTLAIDDFGTGFSSMSYILRHNIDRLKIDRTFISDSTVSAHSAVVTVSIISLAHGLGIKVIAEGVETMDQVNMLIEAGCDDVQGYLFSRPVPPESLRAVLVAHELAAQQDLRDLFHRQRSSC